MRNRTSVQLSTRPVMAGDSPTSQAVIGIVLRLPLSGKVGGL